MFARGSLRRRNARLGRVCKWAGVIGCVLVVIVLVGSYSQPAMLRTQGAMVWLANGCLNAAWTDRPPPLESDGTYYWHPDVGQSPSPHVWFARYRKIVLPDGTLRILLLPLWTVLVALAFPTAILFYRDRRFPPGHCQRCGYDLTGNVSGVCPECGRPTGGCGAGGA